MEKSKVKGGAIILKGLSTGKGGGKWYSYPGYFQESGRLDWGEKRGREEFSKGEGTL